MATPLSQGPCAPYCANGLAGRASASVWSLRGDLGRLWRPVDPPCIRRRLEAVEALGSGVLAGYVLPWMSWPQLVVFGVGFLIGLPAYLGIPVWFVLLGRHFGMASP